MTIWELDGEALKPVRSTTFSAEGVRERADLQRVLRDNVDVIAPEVLVLAEEFGNWADSRRRIDLLGLDRNANLVVIELKRTEDGGHMELQAIRYAAMVSAMTFAKAVEAHQTYLSARGIEENAETQILDFLGWDEPDEEAFGNNVSIILASAEFSREITTSVLWLLQQGIDIRCARLKPYRMEGRLLIDVQQILPLPEAAEYQIQLREKAEKRRQSRESTRDYTHYDLRVAGKEYRDLPKRWLAYRVVRAVVESGVKPEDVAQYIPRGQSRFAVVEGECTEEQFIERLGEQRTLRGGRFDPKRYFVADDQLLRFGGRTYAFSNQWAGGALRSVKALAEAFPGLEIEFCDSTES